MLELCPVTLKAANEYVKEHHRHHGVVVGHKFSIGATKMACCWKMRGARYSRDLQKFSEKVSVK